MAFVNKKRQKVFNRYCNTYDINVPVDPLIVDLLNVKHLKSGCSFKCKPIKILFNIKKLFRCFFFLILYKC